MITELSQPNIDHEDFYSPSAEAPRRFTITPRVIALAPDGSFPMINIGGWLGLPGGRIKNDEREGNFLNVRDTLPTIAREFLEECGVDILEYLDTARCLGITEIAEVNSDKKQITERLAPIYLCAVPKLELREGVVFKNLRDHFEGPLYPDARISIEYFKRCLREHPAGAITPIFLNFDRMYYFQTHPTKGYLWGKPVWAGNE
jgi:8-oxo-dGTP pyrophosphatase MutT (NUDIX family)